MLVERRLEELGLVIPPPGPIPPGFKFSFEWVRIHRNRAFVAGHCPQGPDGEFIGPFGKVPSEVPAEAAKEAARNTALSMLGSLKRALGDLDRIVAWLMVYGMVNADTGFPQTTNAITGSRISSSISTATTPASTHGLQWGWQRFPSTTA